MYFRFVALFLKTRFMPFHCVLISLEISFLFQETNVLPPHLYSPLGRQWILYFCHFFTACYVMAFYFSNNTKMFFSWASSFLSRLQSCLMFLPCIFSTVKDDVLLKKWCLSLTIQNSIIQVIYVDLRPISDFSLLIVRLEILLSWFSCGTFFFSLFFFSRF